MLAVAENTLGLSRQCSTTEQKPLDNHQPSQSSTCTAQVGLNASVVHLAGSHSVCAERKKSTTVRTHHFCSRIQHQLYPHVRDRSVVLYSTLTIPRMGSLCSVVFNTDYPHSVHLLAHKIPLWSSRIVCDLLKHLLGSDSLQSAVQT